MRLVSVVSALLAAAIFSAGCTSENDGDGRASTTTPTSAPTQVASSSTLPSADEASLSAALTASPGPAVAPALAPTVRTAYEKAPFRLLPDGSTVKIDSAAMTTTGDSATVPATVTGGPAAGRWDLLLLRVDGHWLLYGTSKA